MKKFESQPVKIRGMHQGVMKDMAGFLVNGQYYVPTTKKDSVTGDFIYELVDDPTNIEIISSTTFSPSSTMFPTEPMVFDSFL